MSENTQVNPQIIDAVKQAEGNLQEITRLQGNGGAYQQIALSMGMATQNAAQYMQSMLTLSNAATAKALALSLAAQQPQEVELANVTLSLAQNAVQQSIQTLNQVTASALKVLEELRAAGAK